MEVEDPISVKFRTLVESLMAKTTSEIVKVFAEVLMEMRVEISQSWRDMNDLKLEESEEVIFRQEVNINVKSESEDVLVSEGLLQMPEDDTDENTVEQSSAEVHKPTTSPTTTPDISGTNQPVNSANPTHEAQESDVRHKTGCSAESFDVMEDHKSIRKSEAASNSPIQAISMVSPHQPSCSSSTLTSSSPNSEAPAFNSDFLATEEIQNVETAVDEKGIPGFHHVERLADYLVELRNLTTISLTNHQASTIIDLWQNLDTWDKQQIIYVARQQDRIITGGHFQSPGFQRNTRGASSLSALRPDCCRLVEAFFVRLCHIHCNSFKKDDAALTRWRIILQDYRKIRELVLRNGAVIQGTSLQLGDVNLNALIQWHNHRIKDQSLMPLFQEDLPRTLPESEKQNRTLTIRPIHHPAPEHDHTPPESSAEQVKLKRRATGEPLTIRPKLSTQRAPENAKYLQVVPHVSLRAPPVLQTVQMIQPVCSFVCNPPQNSIRQRGTQDPNPPRQKRAYNRVVQGNTCKKCGHFRSAVTGHSQYKGIVYCPKTETIDKKQWLEEMRRKYK